MGDFHVYRLNFLHNVFFLLKYKFEVIFTIPFPGNNTYPVYFQRPAAGLINIPEHTEELYRLRICKLLAVCVIH